MTARLGKAAGLAGSAFFLANAVVLGWTCWYRIDSLGLLLTLVGLLAAADHEEKFSGWHALAAVCFTLAFLDKQTYVAGPISVAFRRQFIF